ncbi:MAG: hypothetical protein Q7S64_01930 [bacterium]|nr:hypothetical protein [bacterium]
MQPCDLAFGAHVYVAQTTVGDSPYKFVVLAVDDSDVYSWWKGSPKRSIGRFQLNTDQPLKIVCELNVTSNSLLEFEAITGAYEAHHANYCRKGADDNETALHHERLRIGTKYWNGGLPARPVNTMPTARFSDNVNTH